MKKNSLIAAKRIGIQNLSPTTSPTPAGMCQHEDQSWMESSTWSISAHYTVIRHSTSQFLLSFIETNLEGFLDTMTSDTLAQRSDLAKQICFAANEFVASINPFWATNYDIVTGCDLDHKSNNQYEIDTTCMTRQGLNCREEFPEYARLSQMPGCVKRKVREEQ